MKILAIETSCDETALCIVEMNQENNQINIEIQANEIASQIALHAQFGGVYPAMAKREHVKNIYPILIQVLKESNNYFESKDSFSKEQIEKLKEILNHEQELCELILKSPLIQKPNIDNIACTYGPGLEPALWVGVNFAQALSYIWDIPLIPVNHMEGHLVSSLLPVYEKSKKIVLKEMPNDSIALLVSGGHTQIVKIENKNQYEIIGQTVDDAVGEAYDKVARMLDLPYPGGPQISKLAEMGRLAPLLIEEGVGGGDLKINHHPALSGTPPRQGEGIKFPRPMMHSRDYNFSFSGLKTAVLYYIRDNEIKNEEDKINIALAFEDAAIDVLVNKTMNALEENGSTHLLLGGGVSANKHLRSELLKKCGELSVTIYEPVREITGDNALMIAMAGYLNPQTTTQKVTAQGNLSL